MFESWDRLLLGLITGIVFGFLLQKGRVAKFRVILGQFLLKDFTVLKVMGTAIVVGGVGIQLLYEADRVALHVKPLLMGGILFGGVFFGAGMALLGYCPGTGVAACGEGRRDAMVGVVGMLCGSAAYVLAYPWLQSFMKIGGDRGELRISGMTDSSPWLWYGILVAIGILLAIIAYANRQWGGSRKTKRQKDSDLSPDLKHAHG